MPIRDWFRGRWRTVSIRCSMSAQPIYEYASRAPCARIVTEHRIGRRDHARTIWRLLMLDQWCSALANGELTHAVTMGRM